jgi:hypothetical protein
MPCCIRRGASHSVGELVAAIRDHIRRSSHQHRPFVRPAVARSIARTVSHCNESLERGYQEEECLLGTPFPVTFD